MFLQSTLIRHKLITVILVGLLLLVSLGCLSEAVTPPDLATEGPSAAWYALYFSSPSGKNSSGPDVPLVAAINAAETQVDVAAYSMTLKDVRDALLSADHRGVKVRIVMESDNMDAQVPQDLMDAGVKIVGDRLEGLMHNKFVVIDGKEVWTGSMNPTNSSAYQDNNNLIRIDSSELARDYETEFEEMYLNDEFGPQNPANTPFPVVEMPDGTRVEVYFAPEDHVSDRLVSVLESAQKSIYLLAYSFTSNPIADALIDRSKHGVVVKGVFDADRYASDQGNDFDRLRQMKLDVHLDGNPGLMHHKVMIIDEHLVVLGSYNFTASADKRNDENLIIIDNPQIAQQMMDEFQRVFAEAQP